MTSHKSQAQGARGAELLERLSHAPPLLPHLNSAALMLQVGLEWGNAKLPRPWASLGLSLTEGRLELELSSLWTQAPSPGPPPGPLWGLWEHEVVECFLVGAGGQYLELEFGPYEHHLAISLEGVRRASRWCLPLQLRCERAHRAAPSLGVWRARASVSARHLPSPLRRPQACGREEEGYLINAFACIGAGEGRRYLLSSPLEGESPDFHQPERFPFYSLSALSLQGQALC